MIQAPQLQYMPAQQPMMMPANYQQQGAPAAVPYTAQTSGYIYNYPTTSCYAQTQTPNAKSQFNGVNIEIINPQGQGLLPQNAIQMPAQFYPVQQPVMVPTYTQPVPMQLPAAQQPVMQGPVAQQPLPQAPVSQAIVEAPVVQQPAVAPVVPAPQIVTPATTVANTPVATTPATQETTPAVPVADAEKVVTSFTSRLQSTSLDEQKAAIEEIASKAKNDNTEGPMLLDTRIFDALLQVVNSDTTGLQGATPEVIDLRTKIENNDKSLTQEQIDKANTPAPSEQAELNKQYAIYTMAYMQERLNNELVNRNGQALELKDLPCIEDIINTAKSNQSPALRHSAISALAHIARPEYKADLTTIFELAKADADVAVQEAATNALAKITK